MDRSFFSWQRQALAGLMAWGIGSVVVGMGLVTQRAQFRRQLGIQFAAWGLIDAMLAVNGRHAARLKSLEPHEPQQIADAARRFRLLAAINAALDVVYIAAGFRLFQTAHRRPERRGMGLGIIIQGGGLLVYDSFLTWHVTRLLSSNQ